MKHTIACWDTETTGVNPIEDRIVEIAFVTKRNGEVISEYQQFINPEMKVSQGAYEVHKISDAFLKDKPTFREVYTDILDYLIQNNLDELGGYNTDFDTIILSREFERLHRENPQLPSMHQYIKKYYPDFIPFKARQYQYNPESDTYSFTGTPIKDYQGEIDALIDMFPCVDLMPPLIQATLSISSGAQSGRESLDTIANRLEIDLERRKEAHGALLDSHITFECYEKAIDMNILARPILELELKFSGMEEPKFELKQEQRLDLNVAKQAVSFKDRKKFKQHQEITIEPEPTTKQQKTYSAKPSF